MSGYPEASESGSEYDEEMDLASRGGGMQGIARKRGRIQKPVQSSKRPRHQAHLGPAEEDATLFDVVRQGKMAMSGIVDNWIDSYQKDRSSALLDLIQFFVNSSGCKGTVTAEMLEEATDGFQDIIKRMTEEFDEDSGDYPLIAPGIIFKRFKSSFCEFVQALVRQCQYQYIYDQYMMENILTLLTELSNSQVRAFRHTSTLAAMKLMTGLVNVALQISVSLDNTQRQYDTERSKDSSKRAPQKLDVLLEKRKELEEQQNEIESMLNGIFKGIYVHRYRDYIADIRALCMEEIGCWMRMFPKVFLTDSYLKYVGWTLHDKQKEVRMKCLQSLIGLYGNNELMNDLKLFTSRFKDRIVSMILDKEYDVAVHAIKLLVLINNNCNYETKVLTDQDCDSIFQLVYSCHRPVAVAAAEFLNIQLFQNKRYDVTYTKSGTPRGANAPHLANLVLFYIESELHEHATYLVDSLWEVASRILKDFECMSDILLEDPAYDNDKMDEKQETALVDIMVCAVKQAAEGVPPSGRQGYHKKAGTREKRQALEDKVKLTEHFITHIPKLLMKFQMDKDKVAGLLQIPRYFDLEYYSTGRYEKYLVDLLDQITIIIEKHIDGDVLEQASRTLKYLCDDEYTFYASKVQPKRRTLIDNWTEKFNLYFDIYQEAGDDADEEEIYNAVQALKRLTSLYVFNDLTSCKLHNSVNKILMMYNEKTDSFPEPLLREAIKFIFYDLEYGLAIAKKHTDAGIDITQPDAIINISDLRQRVTKFLRDCQYLLTYSPHKSVQEECYMSICDILVTFSSQLAHTNPTLTKLVQKASDQLQHAILEFVRTFVFIAVDEDDDEDDTAKIDALHKRRSLLAAVCKLFVFNMIDLKLASSIFQQYIRFYSDYGDIIKETISRSRHHNKLKCAQTLALSLMALFRTTVNEQGGVLDHSSQQYAHMKELARRFALTFGLDQIKTRDAVAELHKEGILFALKLEGDASMDDDSVVPPNLSFLGILVEFSAKLMKQDKKTVVQYLDKHIKSSMLSNQDQDWIPLVTYRNSLLQGADDDSIKVPAPPKGRRGRKKKIGAADPEETGPQTPQRPMTPQQQQPQQQQPQQHRPMTPQHVAPLPQQQQQQPMQMQQPMTPQQQQQQSMTPQSMTSQQIQQPMTPQPMTPQQIQQPMTPQPMTPQQIQQPMTSQQIQQPMTPQPMTPQQIQQPMTSQQIQQPMTPQPPAPHHGRMTPQQTHHAMAPQQQQQQHSVLTPQQHHIQMNPQEAIGQPQLTSTVMQATREIRQIHEDHSINSIQYHDSGDSDSEFRPNSSSNYSRRGKSRTPVKRKRSDKKDNKKHPTPSKQQRSSSAATNKQKQSSNRKQLFASTDDSSQISNSSRRSTRHAATRRHISYAEKDSSSEEEESDSEQQRRGMIRSEEVIEDFEEDTPDIAFSSVDKIDSANSGDSEEVTIKNKDENEIIGKINRVTIDDPVEVEETPNDDFDDEDPFKDIISKMLAAQDNCEVAQSPIEVADSQQKDSNSEPLFNSTTVPESPSFQDLLDRVEDSRSETRKFLSQGDDSSLRSSASQDSNRRTKNRTQSLLNAQLVAAQQQTLAMAATHYSPADYQQQQQHQVPMGYNITSPQAASPMPTNAQYMHATMPNPIVQYDHTNPFQNVTASIQQTPQPSPYYGN